LKSIAAVREAIPDLVYLRRFLFYLDWGRKAEHEFWFDNFTILPVTRD
jgi:hypothetical protein